MYTEIIHGHTTPRGPSEPHPSVNPWGPGGWHGVLETKTRFRRPNRWMDLHENHGVFRGAKWSPPATRTKDRRHGTQWPSQCDLGHGSLEVHGGEAELYGKRQGWVQS